MRMSDNLTAETVQRREISLTITKAWVFMKWLIYLFILVIVMPTVGFSQDLPQICKSLYNILVYIGLRLEKKGSHCNCPNII